MRNPIISIIVPVFNAEETIRKTIASILAQSKNDFELILVDDGSKDNSGIICDEYAALDQRIRVVHQVNAGVSAARNAGIAISCGDYLGFVDADDWIEPKMYARLLEEAETTASDIIMCDAVTVYSDGRTQTDTITQLSGNTLLKKTDFSPSLLLELAGSACRCIYRKRLFGDRQMNPNGIHFPLGIKFSEDRIFNLYAFGSADKIAYVKETYYYRYMNAGSAVHRFHADYFEACKASAKEIEKAIRLVWDDDEELQQAYLGQLITGAEMAICNYYYKTSTLSRGERLQALQKLCNDESLREAIRKYGPDRKSRWILNRNYFALILYALLANLKHGR